MIPDTAEIPGGTKMQTTGEEVTVGLIQGGGAGVERILDGGVEAEQILDEELEVEPIHGVERVVEEAKIREDVVAVGRILGVEAEVGEATGYRKLQSEMVKGGRRTTNMSDVESRYTKRNCII